MSCKHEPVSPLGIVACKHCGHLLFATSKMVLHFDPQPEAGLLDVMQRSVEGMSEAEFEALGEYIAQQQLVMKEEEPETA